MATAIGILKAKPEAGWALTDKRADGHGNVVTVTITREHVTEVFTGFGEKGLSAEFGCLSRCGRGRSLP